MLRLDPLAAPARGVASLLLTEMMILLATTGEVLREFLLGDSSSLDGEVSFEKKEY